MATVNAPITTSAAGTGAGPNAQRRGRIAVAAASGLFGTTAIVTVLLAPELPAPTAAGWRVVIGGLGLVALSVLAGHAPWRYPARWAPTAIGGLSFLTFQCGFFFAVGRVGAATATIVAIGTGPIVAGLIDRVHPGVRLRRRWWIGVAVAAGGIALMSSAEGVVMDPAGWVGAITSGAFFAFFGAAIRDLTTDRPALTAIATVFGAAVLPAAILLAVLGTNPFAEPGSAAAVLYVGVVTTAVSYALWVRGLAVLTLGDTVTLTMLEPITATVLAVLILGEPAGPSTVLGIVIALVGVGVATSPTASRRYRGGVEPLRSNASSRSRPTSGE
jgi:DME family drug/metabolite transporter